MNKITIQDVHYSICQWNMQIQHDLINNQIEILNIIEKESKNLMYNSTITNNRQFCQTPSAKRYSIPNALPIRMPYQNQYPQPQINKLNDSRNNKSSITSREHIVYIDNKAFIMAKNERDSQNNSTHKIVEIKGSRSKSSYNKSNSAKKVNYSHQTMKQSNFYVPVRKTRPQSSVDEKQKQNQTAKQRLTRKIDILQRRISELHLEKQNSQMKFTHENNVLTRQLQIKQQRIRDLQAKLQMVTFELENKCNDLKQAQQKLQDYRQKQFQRVCAERDQYKSITTQNFINLTLTEQIEKVKQCNHQLELQLINYRTENKKYQYCPSIAQAKLQTSEDHLQDLITSMINSRKASSISHVQQQDQIMEVESQHVQIDDIISQIHTMAQHNEQLKNQLEECKNQLFVKDSIANQTARILHEIKEVVIVAGDSNEHVGKIREILTQIY